MNASEGDRAAPPVQETQVVVVGAGPVGLMLAGELRLGGADVVVLEKLHEATTESRASTLHARTMEILDSRGLLEPLGNPASESRGHFGGIPMDLTLPSRYPGQWKVPQTTVERVLGEHAAALGADLRRGWELRDLTGGDGHVDVTVRTPEGDRRIRADHVVACDGQDSAVRRLTLVPFHGRSAERELIRADVAGVNVRDRRFERCERGLAIAARRPDGTTRIMVHEFGAPARGSRAEPGFAELVDSWKRVTGEDLSGGEPLWLNAFDDANRQVARYRQGRVLFAGDAAHQQMPAGGQALNLGLQDAFNLGWKLALEVRGLAPTGLLDTYHTERHAVGERVLSGIAAQSFILLGAGEVEPARALITELLALEEVRERVAGTITGLDVRYPVPEGDSALLGLRLPYLETVEPGSTTTQLLRSGRGLFVTRSVRDRPGWIAELWADRVTPAVADPTGPDAFDGAESVVVRPDGHVVWAGSDIAGARRALRNWFGPPTAGL